MIESFTSAFFATAGVLAAVIGALTVVYVLCVSLALLGIGYLVVKDWAGGRMKARR